jgi:bloom syndrome protein
VLALTATATERVQLDVQQQLHVRHFEFFRSSFNRRNLRYQVRKKSKETPQEMAEIIRTQFARASGIVYCGSKHECEELAAKLRVRTLPPVLTEI